MHIGVHWTLIVFDVTETRGVPWEAIKIRESKKWTVLVLCIPLCDVLVKSSGHSTHLQT